MIQASQTKFKIFEKKKRKQANKSGENAFLSYVKLKHFLLKNSKFTRLNNIITKNQRMNSKKNNFENFDNFKSFLFCKFENQLN